MAIVKVRGMRKVRASINAAGTKWPAAVAWASWSEMRKIFDASQDLVPRDTEELALSARMQFFQYGTADDVVISYDAPHAVKIHEDTSMDAARQERAMSNPELVGKAGKGAGAIGGQSKYLEKPARDAQAGMIGRLEAAVEKNIRAGKTNRRGMRIVKGRRAKR